MPGVLYRVSGNIPNLLATVGIGERAAGVVGVAAPPAKALLYTSGISHELCWVSVL